MEGQLIVQIHHDKDVTIEHWDNQQFISDQKSFGFKIEQWKQLLPLTIPCCQYFRIQLFSRHCHGCPFQHGPQQSLSQI